MEDIVDFILFVLLCCVFNIAVILWDFWLEYKQEGYVKRTIQELIIYFVLIVVSLFGTVILITIAFGVESKHHDNPIIYMSKIFEGIGERTLTLWRKK